MLLCVNNCMYTGKMYRNLAVVEQKLFIFYAFHKRRFSRKFFLHTTTRGPPSRCLPQGPHHLRSTPDNNIYSLHKNMYITHINIIYSSKHVIIQKGTLTTTAAYAGFVKGGAQL